MKFVNIKSILSQTLAIASFTDNEDTTGYIDITPKLPANCVPMFHKIIISGAFAGDTTAVLQIGTSSDLDHFSSVTTVSCLAAATKYLYVPDGVAHAGLSAAQTMRVTVTGASDFGLIVTEATGAMTVETFFFDCQ